MENQYKSESSCGCIFAFLPVTLAFLLLFFYIFFLWDYPVYEKIKYGADVSFSRSGYLEKNFEDISYDFSRVGFVSIEGTADHKVKFCEGQILRNCNFFAIRDFPRSNTTISVRKLTDNAIIYTTLTNDTEPELVKLKIRQLFKTRNNYINQQTDAYHKCLDNHLITDECQRP